MLKAYLLATNLYVSFETMYNDDFLGEKLNERREQNAFRQLRLTGSGIDFCSNDYLGIVHDKLLEGGPTSYRHGSTGSRLLTGNYALIEHIELSIAHFHQAEAALISNSGYDANIGLIASVAQRSDTIIYDQLVHASIRDAIRLSFAQAFVFEHNNMQSLEQKLLQAGGNIFVITESVFSMDGHTCPLIQIISLCKRYKAHLIIDEAHGIGVVGLRGEGLAQHLNLHNDCFARIYTFGKACGCHGAAIVGSAQLRDYLINFSRSFIFSTALPEVAVAAIQKSYTVFPTMLQQRAHLQLLIKTFSQASLSFIKLPSQTAIQGVLIKGNEVVKKVADHLQRNNLDVRPILYPSVPRGKERLRIVLHSFNTLSEVNNLIKHLSDSRNETLG